TKGTSFQSPVLDTYRLFGIQLRIIESTWTMDLPGKNLHRSPSISLAGVFLLRAPREHEVHALADEGGGGDARRPGKRVKGRLLRGLEVGDRHHAPAAGLLLRWHLWC